MNTGEGKIEEGWKIDSEGVNTIFYLPKKGEKMTSKDLNQIQVTDEGWKINFEGEKTKFESPSKGEKLIPKV